MLYGHVRRPDGTLYVVDQWGDRHEPVRSEIGQWTYWLPMYDPDHYEYSIVRAYCDHVWVKQTHRPDWDVDENGFPPFIKCYDPYCPKTSTMILDEKATDDA